MFVRVCALKCTWGESIQIHTVSKLQHTHTPIIGPARKISSHFTIPICFLYFMHQMAIANLLGVAGTDVPIKDIKKLMMPFTVSGFSTYLFHAIPYVTQ